MTGLPHKIYVSTLVIITATIVIAFAIFGADYYSTRLEERFFHDLNDVLKPSGIIGHGAGILGSLMMIVGVATYMVRKRSRKLSRLGLLKHWLEFHIFLCTLGPFLVLYHTTFKFGGLVAVSFWSMVVVVLSGIIGRVIYLQIPRTIEGREMSVNELNTMKEQFAVEMHEKFNISSEMQLFFTEKLKIEKEKSGIFVVRIIKRVRNENRALKDIRTKLEQQNVSGRDKRKIVRVLKSEILLNRRIDWLATMQEYLKYWHILHLPFALAMLVIMIIHVAVAVVFGYTWIF